MTTALARTGFTFDAREHIYRLDDEVLPSVTQVLKHAGLIDYSKIPQDVLRLASHRGRWVHHALQLIDDGLPVVGMPEEYQPWVDAYMRFRADTGFEVLLNEHRSYHSRWKYAGTMDRTGIIAGRRVLIDFKTGLYLPAHQYQLAAYAGLLREPRMYERGILQLRGDGTYKLHHHIRQSFDRDFAIFLGALAQLKRKDTGDGLPGGH